MVDSLGSSSIRIEIDEGFLVKAILGEGTSWPDWIGGRVSVSPLRSILHARRFIDSLNLDLDIFLPRGGAF